MWLFAILFGAAGVTSGLAVAHVRNELRKLVREATGQPAEEPAPVARRGDQEKPL